MSEDHDTRDPSPKRSERETPWPTALRRITGSGGKLTISSLSMRLGAENLLAPNEATAHGRVEKLTDDMEWTSFELGCLLSQIKQNKWFGEYPSFRALVEGKFAIGYGRAIQTINISKTMKGLKINPSRLRHLGWTKLRTICPVVTPENAEEWIKRAEMHTRGELERLVRQARKDGEYDQVEHHERVQPLRRTLDAQLSSDHVVSLHPSDPSEIRELRDRRQIQHDREAVSDRLKRLRTSDLARIIGEALASRDCTDAVEILTSAARSCGLQATFAPFPPDSIAP